MPPFERPSVEAIAAAVRSGRCSALEMAEAALERIAAYDAVQPQAWIERFPPEAVREQARRIDARLAVGEDLPLAGVPYAVKDNIDVAGLPTTAACPAFAYRPEASAAVVARLEAAGALMMGKTNLDQFATGLVGARSPYGDCGCVFNLDYVSGGSSSGSAVVVGAGLVAFALGTDTAGSGRVPAAFNHLVGLKPTRGRWSTRGLVPACRSLDCISVFAGGVADAVLVDQVVAGFDPQDAYSRPQPDVPAALMRRLGVPLAHQRNFLGDGQAQALFEAAVARAEGLGLEVVAVDIAPLLAAARLLYDGPWVAERTANLEDFLRANPGAIHPVVRAILQAGAQVTGAQAFRGQQALMAHARQAEALWAQVDALLLPTTPTIYRRAEVRAEPVALNSNLGLYTNFLNLLDMSAIAMPAGFRTDATGFGVTLAGPAFADRALQALALRWEAAGAFEVPPLDLDGRRPEMVRLAVVGAHLSGMPLHWQLSTRQARLVGAVRTAPLYGLYAIAGASPPKPALVHVGEGGAAIEVEVYELTAEHLGGLMVGVAAPLAIGAVRLADGGVVKGFVGDASALGCGEDITRFGGWRAYVAAQAGG